LVQRVVRAAASDGPAVLPLPRHAPWRRVAGIAASVAFAVMIGSTLGKMSRSGAAATAAVPQERAIAEGLHLDLLARCDIYLADRVDAAVPSGGEDVR